ncbi:bacterial transcriptional regulator family protein [Collimonas arenae]|uniref:Bacterial transcriptional regulator family protein n=1 Tax=Collimonas arenae TaxID=279058 RepID=A0A127QPI3_9BURK|nr:IclR family transcriptional regulator [Collimonas arenae]AMP01846.1 bacterial transcriptional regulator family protein [Collimonas arenae]AMP11745.1 bacterial transcriptional regulator family protein [Collimonas arenae]
MRKILDTLDSKAASTHTDDQATAAPSGTQTLTRGLAVLQAVAGGARDLKEIAKLLGTTRSTTHRLASCLVQERYLRFTPNAGYVLGPKLIELGFQARDEVSLAVVARPYLEQLAEQSGDTIHLALQDDDDVLYLDKIPGKKGLEMRSRVGHRMPIATTGVGKALMLGMDEEDWKSLYQKRSSATSVDTSRRLPKRSWSEFRDQMRQYAKGGYAFDLEDNEPSIRCVAAPIYDASHAIVAAISVSSTVPYMPLKRMQSLIAVVQAAAARISSELGAAR